MDILLGTQLSISEVCKNWDTQRIRHRCIHFFRFLEHPRYRRDLRHNMLNDNHLDKHLEDNEEHYCWENQMVS